MSFDTDLFISYTHIDDQPIPPDEKGWITKLLDALKPMLEWRLGATTQIWRDKVLNGTDQFGAEIEEKLRKTAVLLSILSPRYLESEWCNREVKEFAEVAEEAGGLIVGNRTRLVKVRRFPVEIKESWPDVMRDALGFDFFTYQDERPLELDPMYGPKYKQEYLLLVSELAYALSQLLEDLRGDGSAESSARPTVYLAECAYDMKAQRTAIQAELRRLGHRVLPDRPLPTDEAALVEVVTELLERSDLCVHLVGTGYGAKPDGPGSESLVMVQNRLAAERSRSAGLPRIVWLPDATTSDDAAQQAFIDAMHRDADVQYGADLITAELEALRAAIQASVAKLEAAQAGDPEVASPERDGPKLVYLICTRGDREKRTTVPLRQVLGNHAVRVDVPIFAGDAEAIRSAEHRALRECDEVVLFYGDGDEAWKDSALNNVRKERPDLEPYVYLALPETYDKLDLRDLFDRERLLNGLDGVPELEIESLARALHDPNDSR